MQESKQAGHLPSETRGSRPPSSLATRCCGNQLQTCDLNLANQMPRFRPLNLVCEGRMEGQVGFICGHYPASEADVTCGEGGIS